MNHLKDLEHESIHFYSDDSVGLEAIIAVHSTYSGVSLGGCRMKEFVSKEVALQEVVRLSRHMTYKALLSDLKIGGGKAVILKKKNFRKTPEFLKSFANAINSLKGRYIVSVDMGSDSEDMEQIHKNTDYVIGYNQENGGTGDPGLFTARGVIAGMKAVAVEKWNSSSFRNRKFLIAGIGSVGLPLSQQLLDMGAEVIVTDILPDKIQKIKEYSSKVKVVAPENIYSTSCDFFSPCATGDVFTPENAKDFKCQIVTGAANNQLKNAQAGQVLYERGVLYIPDFAINSGGLIGVVTRGLEKQTKEATLNKIDRIGHLVKNIIQTSYTQNTPTYKVALQMAQKKYKTRHSKTQIKGDLLC